jgi:hypothetical protein
MYRAKTFDEALDKAERLIEDGGYGHTASYILTKSLKRPSWMPIAQG